MQLILVRHAETIDNHNGILYSEDDQGLSETGKKQALTTALQLKNENIAAIYSSDLKRCVKTAQAIAAFHKTVPLFTPELREIGGGKAKNLRFRLPHFVLDVLVYIAIRLNLRAPGGESRQGAELRLKSFLSQLEQQYHDKTVIIVTHNVVVKIIESLLSEKPHMHEFKAIPNGAIRRVSLPKDFA